MEHGFQLRGVGQLCSGQLGGTGSAGKGLQMCLAQVSRHGSLWSFKADDSVRIDMNELLGETQAREQQEEKMRTEKELIEAFEAERVKGSKRPRPNHTDRPRKRTKVDPDVEGTVDTAMTSPAETPDGPSLPVAGMDKKRKTISLEKKPPRVPVVSRAAVSYPCVLCVNTSTQGLLDVFEPSDQVKHLSKSGDGVVRAHEVCANSIPETWISELEGGVGLKPVVAGVNEIGKARWSLVRSLKKH